MLRQAFTANAETALVVFSTPLSAPPAYRPALGFTDMSYDFSMPDLVLVAIPDPVPTATATSFTITV